MLLVTPPGDTAAKRAAITHTSASLGGLRLPAASALRRLQRTDTLRCAFDAAVATAAKRHVGTASVAVALAVRISDVELVRNPASGNGVLRPNTFSHAAVLVVSPAGAHVLQGYGPRGYTLRMWMERREREESGSNKSPAMSIEAARASFVDPITRILEASASTGAFSSAANADYAAAFGVDLLSTRHMRLGSQLDAYVSVEAPLVFTSATVKANLKALPRCGCPKAPCADADVASGRAPPPGMGEPVPDGGVPHSYVPAFADAPPAR